MLRLHYFSDLNVTYLQKKNEKSILLYQCKILYTTNMQTVSNTKAFVIDVTQQYVR